MCLLNSFVNEFRYRENAVVEDPAQDVGLAFFESIKGGFDRLPACPARADDQCRGLGGTRELQRVLGRADTVSVDEDQLVFCLGLFEELGHLVGHQQDGWVEPRVPRRQEEQPVPRVFDRL